jgi:membrane protein YdbS with pleckstrin-like domain
MPKNTPELEEDYKEFPGQRDSEEVIMVLFKHWYTLVLPIVIALTVIIVSFALPLWWGVTDFIFRYGFTAALYYLWLVFWVCSIVYNYITWYRARYIVTSERIIDIDQKSLFNRQVSEVDLDRIQNITHTIKGPAATLLNFGTVIIQSAGATDITLDDIAEPDEIQEEIARLIRDIPAESPVDPAAVTDFIKRQKS